MLDTETVEKKLREIVVKVLQVSADRIRPECRFKEDLGADSLDQVLLLYEIEDALGFEIPDTNAKGILTFADATRLALEILKTSPQQ